jgi:hypothetical protein
MTEDREIKINKLVEDLLEREVLLRQYALWLETSEENTINKGKDVYDMFKGAMQALSDVDFIPGIDNRNFIEVILKLQEKTGLDLGLCEHFRYYPDKISRCAKSKGYITSSVVCSPPVRYDCKYRNSAPTSS